MEKKKKKENKHFDSPHTGVRSVYTIYYYRYVYYIKVPTASTASFGQRDCGQYIYYIAAVSTAAAVAATDEMSSQLKFIDTAVAPAMSKDQFTRTMGTYVDIL